MLVRDGRLKVPHFPAELLAALSSSSSEAAAAHGEQAAASSGVDSSSLQLAAAVKQAAAVVYSETGWALSSAKNLLQHNWSVYAKGRLPVYRSELRGTPSQRLTSVCVALPPLPDDPPEQGVREVRAEAKAKKEAEKAAAEAACRELERLGRLIVPPTFRRPAPDPPLHSAAAASLASPADADGALKRCQAAVLDGVSRLAAALGAQQEGTGLPVEPAAVRFSVACTHCHYLLFPDDAVDVDSVVRVRNEVILDGKLLLRRPAQQPTAAAGSSSHKPQQLFKLHCAACQHALGAIITQLGQQHRFLKGAEVCLPTPAGHPTEPPAAPHPLLPARPELHPGSGQAGRAAAEAAVQQLQHKLSFHDWKQFKQHDGRAPPPKRRRKGDPLGAGPAGSVAEAGSRYAYSACAQQPPVLHAYDMQLDPALQEVPYEQLGGQAFAGFVLLSTCPLPVPDFTLARVKNNNRNAKSRTSLAVRLSFIQTWVPTADEYKFLVEFHNFFFAKFLKQQSLGPVQANGLVAPAGRQCSPTDEVVLFAPRFRPPSAPPRSTSPTDEDADDPMSSEAHGSGNGAAAGQQQQRPWAPAATAGERWIDLELVRSLLTGESIYAWCERQLTPHGLTLADLTHAARRAPDDAPPDAPGDAPPDAAAAAADMPPTARQTLVEQLSQQLRAGLFKRGARTVYNGLCYFISDIDFTRLPTDFCRTNKGQDQTYVDYYKTKNIVLKDGCQPLLLCHLKKIRGLLAPIVSTEAIGSQAAALAVEQSGMPANAVEQPLLAAEEPEPDSDTDSESEADLDESTGGAGSSSSSSRGPLNTILIVPELSETIGLTFELYSCGLYLPEIINHIHSTLKCIGQLHEYQQAELPAVPHIADSALLKQVFTHISYANERELGLTSNQRLEWLGDAILELCVSTHLYGKYPQASQGDLTTLRCGGW
eukprot:TRINITY_DN9473_c0_g1_i1.p1 TRINITY_DN9473_c0_g1~~TRINITY_DN9473_c0_g1_i1.p1  ORF type:complete len:934 (-),score=384.16 TRINITY_DN9473_c0_g1_i1:1443-4244(-)